MKLSSVQKDSRGEVSILEELISYPELTIFRTKAGYARGGCIHRIHDEFVVVVEGCIEYVCYTPTGLQHTKMFAGERMKVMKNTPHYFISWTDSTVLEWGATVDEKKEKHEDFRNIVDEINIRNEASVML